MAHLRPVTDQITEPWDIVIAKEQPKPKPSPLFCTRKVFEPGFRLTTFHPRHSYIEDCRTYNGYPEDTEMADKLLPPGRKIDLAVVPPGVY